MNFVKTLIVIIKIFLVTGIAVAQNTAVGLRIGASSFTVKNDLFEEDAKFMMGLDIAIPIELSLSPVLSLQPELHYTQKGVAFEGQYEGQNVNTTFKTNYLELPVLLKANYGSERFKCFAFVGPSIGYAMKQTVSEKIDDVEKVKEELDFITDGNIQDRRWDFSAVGGIGASMKAGVGSIVLDVRYSMGFSDTIKFDGDKPGDWEKSTNRGCTLSLGYMLPIK